MLFLGGLRDADELLAEFDAVGLGVEDILIAASSCDMSAILISGEAVDIVSRKCSPVIDPNTMICYCTAPLDAGRCDISYVK